MTFFDRFGLRESSGDFFKIKYLHAGILYWLFPAIVTAPLYGFYITSRFGKESSKEGVQEFRVYIPSALLVTNLLLVFYVLATFAPPGFATQKEFLVPTMFLTTILGVILIRIITEKYIKETVADAFGNYARWTLCLSIVVGLDWYALYGLWGFLWEILWGGGMYFFVFLFTTAFIIERTRVRGKTIHDRRQRTTIQVIAFCLMVATYYLSVLAFALRLYPYIPVTKGGGDYVGAPNVILCFQETNGRFLLPDLVGHIPNECTPSKPLQIIEESATSIFVADPDDVGGPAAWRVGKKPKVYEIRRDKIGSITFLN